MPEKAALIAALIVERPVCVTCLTDKTGCTEAAIEGYSSVIKTTLVVYRDTASCSICAGFAPAFAIGVPEN